MLVEHGVEVRTTHGISVFTYDLDDTRSRTPNFYSDYGYWDGYAQEKLVAMK